MAGSYGLQALLLITERVVGEWEELNRSKPVRLNRISVCRESLKVLHCAAVRRLNVLQPLPSLGGRAQACCGKKISWAFSLL